MRFLRWDFGLSLVSVAATLWYLEGVWGSKELCEAFVFFSKLCYSSKLDRSLRIRLGEESLFTSMKHVRWVSLGFVLFDLSSRVGPKVSPLILALLVTLGMLYEAFFINSLKVSPLVIRFGEGPKFQLLLFNLLICNCLLRCIISPFICLLQWKIFDLLLEEQLLWLWLCGSNLVNGMGYNWRNEYLCGCCVTVFSHI